MKRRTNMRKTASEIIRNLEQRIARLERQATHPLDVYHPSELVDGYTDRGMARDYDFRETTPSEKEKELTQELKRKGYVINFNQALGNTISVSALGYHFKDLRDSNICESLVKSVMYDLGLRGKIKDVRGEKVYRGDLDGFEIVISCGSEEGLSFSVNELR
jgi:hypothetical protein